MLIFFVNYQHRDLKAVSSQKCTVTKEIEPLTTEGLVWYFFFLVPVTFWTTEISDRNLKYCYFRFLSIRTTVFFFKYYRRLNDTLVVVCLEPQMLQIFFFLAFWFFNVCDSTVFKCLHIFMCKLAL